MGSDNDKLPRVSKVVVGLMKCSLSSGSSVCKRARLWLSTGRANSGHVLVSTLTESLFSTDSLKHNNSTESFIQTFTFFIARR